jgi:cell division protein FtsI (penicillin-binding protein 3)
MIKQTATETKFKARYLILLIGFGLIFFAVVGRLAYLHILKHEFLLSQGEARTVREVKVSAYRGMIKDRNGESLAISTPVDSVWMNPQQVDLADPKLSRLAQLLDMPLASLQDKIRQYSNTKKEFAYLRRHIDPSLGAELKSLKVAGINLQPEYRRYYPTGEVTAHVLGFTDIDDNGQEGLELAFNGWLKGKAGKKRIEQDRLGREVEYLANISDVQPGSDLTLSVDERLQYLAYKAVKAAVEKHKAVSGSAVILDVKTGEVLAMVNDPSYNPNKREKDGQANNYRNCAVTDAFEPGSVIKTFSLASVLENTKITPATLIDTQPGYMKLQGKIIRDVHNNGVLDVASILKESSNIAITKLVLNLEPRDLWDTYDRLGFGWSTGSGFPGENAGVLTLPRPQQDFVLATMSFGYGLAVTPLQLAQAYAIIGAGGIKRPISFLKVDTAPAGTRVLNSNVARQVMAMLTIAVEHDKSNARVAGYHVAGKTGTVRIVGKEGYEQSKYRAVFGGLAPAINPRIAIVVAINQPSTGEYYGNQVAAPVFSRIASGALRLMKIAPDLLDTHGVHVAHNGNGNRN